MRADAMRQLGLMTVPALGHGRLGEAIVSAPGRGTPLGMSTLGIRHLNFLLSAFQTQIDLIVSVAGWYWGSKVLKCRPPLVYSLDFAIAVYAVAVLAAGGTNPLAGVAAYPLHWQV